MHARRILALALSAGLAVSPVVSAVAPTSAFAVKDISNGLKIKGHKSGRPTVVVGGDQTIPDAQRCDVKSVSVGGYVYKDKESAPFVIGADDEVAVTFTVGCKRRANSYDLCLRRADGSVEVLGTQSATWTQGADKDGKQNAWGWWPISQDITIKASGSKITTKGSVFVRLPDGEVSVPLNIMELDKSEHSFPNSLDLGLESAAFTFPGGIDIIGGSTVSFGRGSIPFKEKMEKDGTRVRTIGVDDKTLDTWSGGDELANLEKAKQDYSNMVGSGSGGFGFKSFVPVWKIAAIYRWNPQIPRKNGASMAFAYGMRGGFTGQLYVFTADLDFTGMLGFRGSYGIDYNGNSKLAVGPTGSLTARLGVGLGKSFIGRVGAYGEAKLDAWYLLLPKEDSGWESATLSGTIGAEAVALGKKIFDWPIIKGGPWYIVKPSHPYLTTAAARELLEGNEVEEAFAGTSANVLGEDLSRAYLAHTSAWLGSEDVRAEAGRALSTASDGGESSATASSGWARVLQEGGYPDAQVSIAETPSGKIMLWLRDDPSRTDANRSQLVWSRHDESSGSWSDPLPVADNNTADFDPVLFVDDAGCAHVAWLDASEPLEDGLTLEQTAERMGVSYAKLENGADAFSAAEQVAAAKSGEAKAAPELAAAGDGIVAGWATYEASHLLDANGTHDVVLALRGQDGWSTRVVANDTSSSVSSLGTGVLDGKLSMAWTEDADGDLTGQDDTRLLACTADLDTPVVIATGGVSNVHFAKHAGEGALTWKGSAASASNTLTTAVGEAEGADALWSITALGGEPQAVANGVNLPSSYQVDGDLSHGAMISYAAISDGGARVYGRSLSVSGGLGDEGLLLTHADNITSWDLTGSGDRLSAAFAAERGVGSDSGEADLCVADSQSSQFMQLSNVVVTGDQVPGGTVEIAGEVTNVGALTLDGVTMRLLEEGDFKLTQDFEGDIKPGETREVCLEYTLPNDFIYDTNRTLELCACLYGTAGTANSASVNVHLAGAARLEAEAFDVPYGEREQIFFELTNHGTQEVSGTAHLFTTDENGAEVDLDTAEFGPIAAGEVESLEVSPVDVATFEKMGIEYLGVRLESSELDGDVLTGTHTWNGELLAVSGEPVESGWAFEDGTWYVRVSAEGLGSWHKTGWHWDGGWYYLDPAADGAMVSGWREVDGRTYWFNTRHDGRFGRMATGWISVDSEWYFMDPSGAMRRCWAWDASTKAWYYLRKSDGQMLRDTTTPDGHRVDATGRWVS